MTRDVRDRIVRARARADVASRQTWEPEIVGAVLLLLAVLSTAGLLG